MTGPSHVKHMYHKVLLICVQNFKFYKNFHIPTSHLHKTLLHTAACYRRDPLLTADSGRISAFPTVVTRCATQSHAGQCQMIMASEALINSIRNPSLVSRQNF